MKPDALEAVRTAPREMLPSLLAAIASRLAEPVPVPEKVAECSGDKLLTAEQVALALGMDVGAVSRRCFPFKVKLGHRTVRYSSEGLARWVHGEGGSNGRTSG